MNETKTLLIVDDEEDIRENLRDFAEFKGFKVLEASNGREALAVIEAGGPDLVISDLKMPVMDGLEMLKEIQARPIEIPVVIMTAFGTMEYAINAMKNGAADFIAKPIDLPYMMRVTERVLKRSEMERRVKEQQQQLDEDLEHAALIQRCLLPAPADTPRLALEYRYEPLIAIGGDYMTVHQYSDDKIAVALYDVSGHGVSAAFTANLVHTQLMRSLEEWSPPSASVDRLNGFVTSQIGKTNMFITLVLAMVDAGEGSLMVCNAGHPDLHVWHAGRAELESVPSHVPPVGFSPNILGGENESRIDLASGDRVVMYTDGFCETRLANGKPMGLRGVREMTERLCRESCMGVIDGMFGELARLRAGDPDDDLTAVEIRIK